MSDPALPLSKQSPLLSSLSSLQQKAHKEFTDRHAVASIWLNKRGLVPAKLRAHSTKLLTGATLSGMLLLAAPPIAHKVPTIIEKKATVAAQDTLTNLPKSQVVLTSEQETAIEAAIEDKYGIRAVFEMDQNRLPANFGTIGLEQHLYRYPGDGLSLHANYQEAGIAPARGAFGYFSEVGKSVIQMEQEERYYSVIQLFALPEWNAEWTTLKDWYKFRKLVVINPENGNAVVTALGDAGPAFSTRKQFGGSPEVMAALGWYPRQTKGNVVILFLDDPDNSIPLGPITIKET